MANRHNVIQTPPREKRQSLAQLQLQAAAGTAKSIPQQANLPMPLSESIKNLINSGSSSGLPMLPFSQQPHFNLQTQPLSIPTSSLQSTSSISTSSIPSPSPSTSTSVSISEKVSVDTLPSDTLPGGSTPTVVSDRIEIESCSSLYEKDVDTTEDGIISIDTVEAEEDTRSKFADFEKDQIMPQELFTN